MRLPERLGRSPLYSFFLRGALWLIALTVLWSQVADWTMRPAAATAHFALKSAFPWWVGSAKFSGDSFEMETHIQVPAANAPPGTNGVLIADCKPSRYGYGLPMLLALLLAGRSRRLLRNALIGLVALVPFQAFSIAFDILKQIAVAGGPAAAAQAGFSPFFVNAVALSYQFGVLLLPALMPIMIWLMLEPQFLSSTVLPSLSPPAPEKAAEDSPPAAPEA